MKKSTMGESNKTEKFTKISFLAMILMLVHLCKIRYRYNNGNNDKNKNDDNEKHLCNIRYRY